MPSNQHEKVFTPKIEQNRLTEHYLPEKVKSQDFESPRANQLSWDRHIIGIGDYGNLQFYFIFNDNSHTELQKRGSNSKNKETLINPAGSIIKKVRVQYFNNYSD